MDTKVLEIPIGWSGRVAGPADPRRRALTLLAAGTALMVAAGVLVTTSLQGGRPAPAGEPVVVEPAGAGFPDVGVAANVYEPGHSSGWHTHPGVHSAVVLSGTLTVIDAACVRHDYAAGDTYLGGRDAHVARNDTLEPVQLAVTYVFARVSPLDHATVVAPPAGCEAR